MDAQFLTLFDEKRIEIGIKAKDTKEAIRIIGGLMAKDGVADDHYWEDVYKREQTFPTGLPTNPIPVAIPHADPDHVFRNGIAIGILEQPVKFKQMGLDNSSEMDIKVIFMLALKEHEKIIGVIRDLMKLIQSQTLLAQIEQAKTPAEIIHAIGEGLK